MSTETEKKNVVEPTAEKPKTPEKNAPLSGPLSDEALDTVAGGVHPPTLI